VSPGSDSVHWQTSGRPDPLRRRPRGRARMRRWELRRRHGLRE
jgi:hypothetical protein